MKYHMISDVSIYDCVSEHYFNRFSEQRKLMNNCDIDKSTLEIPV